MNKTTTSELKPCPFCGAAAHIKRNGYYYSIYSTHDTSCIIYGQEITCPSTTVYLKSMVEDWNHRAGESNKVQSANSEELNYNFLVSLLQI